MAALFSKSGSCFCKVSLGFPVTFHFRLSSAQSLEGFVEMVSTLFSCLHFWWRLVLLPRKSHGWRSLVGCSPSGREKLDMTERLHFHFSLSCFGEGNGNPLQCFCLENPRDRGAWWVPSMGSHRVGHDWSDLAAAAAAVGKSLCVCDWRRGTGSSWSLCLCLGLLWIVC